MTTKNAFRRARSAFLLFSLALAGFLVSGAVNAQGVTITPAIYLQTVASPVSGPVTLAAETNLQGEYVRYIIVGPEGLQHDVFTPVSTNPIVYEYSWATTGLPDGLYDITVELWGHDPNQQTTTVEKLASASQTGIEVLNPVTVTANIPATGSTDETVQLICSTNKAVSNYGVAFKVSQDNQGVLGGTVYDTNSTTAPYDYIFEVLSGQLSAGEYLVQCQTYDPATGNYEKGEGNLTMTSPSPTVTLVQPVNGSTFSESLEMEANSGLSSTSYGFLVETYDASSGAPVDSQKLTVSATQNYVNGSYVWVWTEIWYPPTGTPSPAKVIVTPFTAEGYADTSATVKYEQATTLSASVDQPPSPASGTLSFTVRSNVETVEVDVYVLTGGDTVVAGPLGASYSGQTEDPNGNTIYLFQTAGWNSETVTDGTYQVLAEVYPSSSSLAPVKTDPKNFDIDNTATPTIYTAWSSPAPSATVSGTQDLVVKTDPAATAVDFTITSASGAKKTYPGAVADPANPHVFSYEWDTTGWPDGTYGLSAQAYYETAPSGDPAALSVKVDNAPEPEPVQISVSEPDPNTALGSPLVIYASFNQLVEEGSCRFILRVPATTNTAPQVVAKSEVASEYDKNCRSEIDTSTIEDGVYELVAQAMSPTQTEPLAETTVGGLTKSTTTAPTLAVNLVGPTAGTHKGTINIKGTTNLSVDKAVAQINPSSADTATMAVSDLPMKLTDSTTDSQGNTLYTWSAAWDTVQDGVPDGDYDITMWAQSGSDPAQSSDTVTVTLANDATTEPATTEIAIVQPTSLEVAQPLSGTVVFAAKASPRPDSVHFKLRPGTLTSGPEPSAQFDSTTGLWIAKWDSARYADGSWTAKAVAITGSQETGRSTALSLETKNEPALTVAVTSPEGTVSGLTGMAATTSKAADSLLFRFYSSDATVGQPPDIPATAADSSNTTWSATWDTETAANSTYTVRAIAQSNGVEAKSDPKTVTVYNQDGAEEQSTTGVTVKLTAPAGDSEQGGSFVLAAATDRQVGRLSFQMKDVSTNQSLQPISGVSDSAGTAWKARANTADKPIPDGQYRLKAVAFIGTSNVGESSSINLTVKTAAIVETTGEETETTTGEETGTAPTVAIGRLPAVVSGNQVLAAKASPNASAVRFSAKNSATGTGKTFTAVRSTSDGLWRALWQTASMPDGRYEIRASVKATNGQTATAGPVAVAVENVMETAAESTTPEGETVALNQVQVIPKEVVRQAILDKPEGTKEVTAQPVPPAKTAATEDGGEKASALDPECVKYSISAAKCESWLSWQNRKTNECRRVGILTKEECLGYLKSKYGQVSEEEATKKTAGLLSADKLSKLEKGLVPLIGSTFKLRPAAKKPATETAATTETAPAAGEKEAAALPSARPDLTETYQELRRQQVPTELEQSEAEETLSEFVSVKPKKDVSLLVHASPAYVTNREGQVQKQLPAIVMIDEDGDGLPNDTEKRLGTDPKKPDTDGDGFNDKTELENGYDPLRVGRRLAESAVTVTPVDAAIIAGAPMEQPKATGTESKELTVEAAESLAAGSGDSGETAAPSMRLRGRAKPGQTVTIYVYSYLPLVMTTTANDDGTWSYDLSDSIVDGEHEAYVAVNDDTGKIKEKSVPLSFLVSEAQAATEQEYFNPTAMAAEAPAKKLMSWYLIGAGLLILAAIIIGVMIFSRAMKRQEPEF